MRRTGVRRQLLVGLTLVLLLAVGGYAQTITVPRTLVTFPDLILFNGKIITVDNRDLSSDLGRIVPAMAVREGRVLALGADSEIRALAGPQTRIIDLKSRAVIPGFIDTHDHPQDWVLANQAVVNRAVQDQDIVIRYLNGPGKEKLENFEPTLRKAVQAARPGQWIIIFLSSGPRYEWLHWDGPAITNKAQLDQLAPNNPVVVLGFATGDYIDGGGTLINSKGIEEYSKVHELHPTNINVEMGAGGTQLHRTLQHDVIFQGRVDLLEKMYRGELSWWTGYGVTTMGSSLEGLHPLTAYANLDKRGELPIRLAWGYREVPLRTDELALRRLSSLVGYGSDHLWFIGAHSASGGSATAAPASPEVKRRERSSFAPGTRGRADMERLIKSGMRIATMHSAGDQDIDFFLEVIEKASREAGMSLEDIRAKRHSFDHSFMIRPDQLVHIKRLGVLPSAGNDQYWETSPRIAETYGVEYTNWMTPRRSFLQEGMIFANEFDEHFSQTAFTLFDLMEVGVTRTAIDGRTYAPGQAISREVMLKSATVWSADYVLREEELGSLEEGKWADFMVLSDNYLTVPEKEIHTLEPLLTAVGGEIMHLAPSLAREIGLQPVGDQVELGRVGGNPESWRVSN